MTPPVALLQAWCQALLTPPIDPPQPTATTTTAALLPHLLARPWRRTQPDATTLHHLTRAMDHAITTHQPLVFTVPFGGYKHWRLPNAPHVNWAEVFWLDYLLRYGQQIAAVHPPGVAFHLTYVQGVLGYINGLPQHDQDTYITELQTLLPLRQTSRVTFTLVNLSELHGGDTATLAWLQQQAPHAPNPNASQLASATRNRLPHGPSPDEAARRCALMEALPMRRAYNKHPSRIQITHIRGASLALHLGSCRTTTLQPWVGLGYVQSRQAPGGHAWQEALASAAAYDKLRGLIPLPTQAPAKLPGLRTLLWMPPDANA